MGEHKDWGCLNCKRNSIKIKPLESLKMYVFLNEHKGKLAFTRSPRYEQLRSRPRSRFSQNFTLYTITTTHLAPVHKNNEKIRGRKIRAPARNSQEILRSYLRDLLPQRKRRKLTLNKSHIGAFKRVRSRRKKTFPEQFFALLPGKIKFFGFASISTRNETTSFYLKVK